MPTLTTLGELAGSEAPPPEAIQHFPAEWLAPTWTHERLPVDGAAEAESVASRLLDAPGVQQTVWLGREDVLKSHGLEPGGDVKRHALVKGILGQHVGEQIQGTHVVADTLTRTWRHANQAQRTAIERSIVEGTQAGLNELIGTDAYAAAAVLEQAGSGKDAKLQVRWIVITPGQGKGIDAPLAQLSVGANFRAEEASIGPILDMAPQLAELEGSRELSGRVPLDDSMAKLRSAFDDATVKHLQVQASDQHWGGDFDNLTDEELRDLLPDNNPFDALDAADLDAAIDWWEFYADDPAVATRLAVEYELIIREIRYYRKIAQSQEHHRRTSTANPMKAIFESHSRADALSIERAAAVRASRLPGMPADELRQHTQETWAELRRAKKNASLETHKEAVAIQNYRNVLAELERTQGQTTDAPDLAQAAEQAPTTNVGREPDR